MHLQFNVGLNLGRDRDHNDIASVPENYVYLRGEALRQAIEICPRGVSGEITVSLGEIIIEAKKIEAYVRGPHPDST